MNYIEMLKSEATAPYKVQDMNRLCQDLQKTMCYVFNWHCFVY